ncbi:MAG: S-layer homology domain-containing protein [Acidimicrobiia bacterium]
MPGSVVGILRVLEEGTVGTYIGGLVETDPSGRFAITGFSGLPEQLTGAANIGVFEYDETFGDPVVVDMFGDTTDPGEAILVPVLPGSETSGITIVLGGPDPTNVDLPDPIDDVFRTTFASDILWMQRANITQGCNPPANTLFCPDDQVTRGQMAAFLVRALDLTDSDPDIDFSDDDDSVFQADIERLATAGITTGCGGDRFCPDDPVTRGQMAAFLVRALDFTDDNGSVFEADIERLAAAGVTSGCGPTTFCPNDNVTRGQMAAFLRRALED